MAALLAVACGGGDDDAGSLTTTTRVALGEQTHMGEVVVITRGDATAAVTVWNPHAVEGGTALDVEVDVQADAGEPFMLADWSMAWTDGGVQRAEPGGVADEFFYPGQIGTAPVTFAVPLTDTEGAAVRVGLGDGIVASWRLG